MPRRHLLLLGLSLGCTQAPRPTPVLEASPTCVVTEPDTLSGDTIPILLRESLNLARAPLPVTDAEALVFRQLYETLVRIDCEGRIRPGLATAWRSDGGPGLEWTFTLRPNAAFWDGSPLDATTVLEGWRTTDTGTFVAGVRSEDRTLTVFLSEPRPLAQFAGPALRVVKRLSESTWPLGTGSWSLDPAASGSRLVATPARRSGSAVSLIFEPGEGTDARDLLDAGTSVLVTRDPGAMGYAAGLAGWADVALGWDRLYVLLSPEPKTGDGAVAPSFLTALAQDAAGDDGRPADADAAAWLARCIPETDTVPGPRAEARVRRVLYPREDTVARAVAERLVARAESDLSALLGPAAFTGVTTITAVGLDPEPFARALLEREGLALVAAVLHQGDASCAVLDSLGRGWGLMTPLIETRPHALVRRGSARVVWDQSGLVIEPVSGRR